MQVLEATNIQLRFVPLTSLVTHEEDDPFRVKRLVRAIHRDAKMRNPIIVTPCSDDQYMVMDGATRTSALIALGMRDVLVQIVNYTSENVSLQSWHHVVVGIPPHRLMSNLSAIAELKVQRVDRTTALEMAEQRASLATIVMCSGDVFAVLCAADENCRPNILCQLVSTYRGKAEVHRTIEEDLPELAKQYPTLTALILFPTFSPKELLQITRNGNKVPMGITRHIIAGRALGLGAPLELLDDARTLAEKNEWLNTQLRHRLRANKIRLYQEPVFIFDE